MLTERQELVLRRLVEEYLDAGAPVGSKALSAAFEWGPSTIRHELANLEELGLLAHPHTSAGRVPTEAGYRYFVDRLLPETSPGPALSLTLVRRELDEAMRVTTEALSQVTNLLAIVTAPPIETSTDPPRRGAGPAAPGADGGGDHLHRRRDQAAVHLPAARSTPAWPTGPPATSTSGWSAWAWARGCSTSGCTTPTLSATEAAFLEALCAGVHRPRGVRAWRRCTSRGPASC